MANPKIEFFRFKLKHKTDDFKTFRDFMVDPTLKSKACLKCLYLTKIISDLCRYLEYFSYLYTIN